MLSGCRFFETKIEGSLQTETIANTLDTSLSFTKTVLTDIDIEKKVFSRAEDSLMFFKDLEENASFQLDKIRLSPVPTLDKEALKEFGLEYDSVSVTRNSNKQKATFYSTKNSPLFDIQKTCFITFDSTKVFLKTIKITQQLLHEDSKDFEINYSYNY